MNANRERRFAANEGRRCKELRRELAVEPWLSPGIFELIGKRWVYGNAAHYVKGRAGSIDVSWIVGVSADLYEPRERIDAGGGECSARSLPIIRGSRSIGQQSQKRWNGAGCICSEQFECTHGSPCKVFASSSTNPVGHGLKEAAWLKFNDAEEEWSSPCWWVVPYPAHKVWNILRVQVLEDLPRLAVVGLQQEHPVTQWTSIVPGAFLSISEQDCEDAQQRSCKDGGNEDSASHAGYLSAGKANGRAN